ncbi:MAG: YkgJ family cysteine cluster protein [Anaerovoracaceae bacterium]|nr:YkgJ family cysteine cluster protein [Bacillota bacterium]MDY2670327.1 YkgJ family cysteine cluster protein [Anaerovoracaceae bacterium]
MQNKFQSHHVKNLNQNFITRDSKFKFRCTQCGDCCRNKKLEDMILLTTMDVYRLCNILEMDTTDMIGKYCDMIPGKESMLPLLIMKQRLDGSCIFLKKGKCTVHEGKPLLCTMYPLGRISLLNEEKGVQEFHYFLKDFKKEGCKAAEDEEQTVTEWLERYDLEQYDECARLYGRLGNACSKMMHALDSDDQRREMFMTSFYMMFLKYDRDQPLEEQMAVNLAYVQSLKPDMFFGDKLKS